MIADAGEPALTELCDLSAVEQRTKFGAGEVSARELLDSHRQRIADRNPELNAVVAANFDVATKRAGELDEAQAQGQKLGPLAGLVTAHKDLADTVDFPTTYGSPLFSEHRPAVDDLLVARMKSAGAIAVGKTNTPEFGAGSNTFNPVYGATVNAYDSSRSAGGSSGGAAVALATAMVAIADGSDMGGSLRNPAAWNNVVGMRPSPGRVPNIGPGNGWSTMGTSGPMARSVDDLALLFGVLAVGNEHDPMSRGFDAVGGVSAKVKPPLAPLRVAWSPDLGGLPIEADVAGVLEEFIKVTESLGWHVEENEPDFSGADECFLTLRAWAFASSPLGALTATELEKLKPTVQLEVAEGKALSASDVASALAHLKVLWQRSCDFFSGIDLMIAPVTQLSPFPVSEEFPARVAGQEMDRYTDWMKSCCRITTSGLPTLSLPAGFTEAGLAVGAQLVGGPWGDVELLGAAKALESARSWEPGQPSRVAVA